MTERAPKVIDPHKVHQFVLWLRHRGKEIRAKNVDKSLKDKRT